MYDLIEYFNGAIVWALIIWKIHLSPNILIIVESTGVWTNKGPLHFVFLV